MPTPLISPGSVLLLSCGFGASYLASIYLVPSARIRLDPPPSPAASTRARPLDDPADIATPRHERRDRNHPSVIKSRLVAVSLSSLCSLASIPYVLPGVGALDLVGLALPPTWSERANLVAYPLALTASLFAGSVYIQYLEGDLPFQARGGRWKSLKERFDGWRGIRNYVIASPALPLDPSKLHH